MHENNAINYSRNSQLKQVQLAIRKKMSKHISMILAFALLLQLLTISPSAITTTMVNYRFENNSNDSTSAANGELKGTPSFVTNDKKEGNYSLALNGISDYTEVADNNAVDMDSSSFSVSVWAKRVSDGNNYRLISKAEGINRLGYEIIASSSGVFAYISDGINRIMIQKTSLTLSNWSHIVLNVDRVNGLMKLYINSVESASVGISVLGINSISNTRPLRIGADSVVQTAASFWNGNIDDVRIYKKLLNTTEIASVYKNGISATLVGYYKFNNDAYNSSNSSTNTNGTLVGNANFNAADKKEGTSSLALNGSTDYVQVADNDALDVGNGDFSIAFWAKRVSGGRIISKTEGVSAPKNRLGYEVLADASNVYAWVSDGTNRITTPKVAANLANWTHISVNVNRTTNMLTMYVDSVQKAEFSISALGTSSISNARPLRIGADGNVDTAASFFGGKIDDVRINKKLLSQDEITNIFNGGYPENTAALKEVNISGKSIVGFDSNTYKYKHFIPNGEITVNDIVATPLNSTLVVTKNIVIDGNNKKAIIEVASADELSLAVYEIEFISYLEIENLLCTVDGEDISFMQDFPALESMTVNFQLTSTDDVNCKVIIAVYNSNKRLSGIKIESTTLSGVNNLSFNMLLPNITAGNIKVMLLSDLEDIKPLVGAKEIFVPWQMASLTKTTPWSNTTDFQATGVSSIYYDGMDYKGAPTKIFAYLGIPESNGEKVPGVVLVHGGGGTAYADWVKEWNLKGYAAIAMDLEGHTPDGQIHSMSGPQRIGFFGDLDKPINEQWAYHANSAIILANNLLRSLSEVDENKVGIVGVSWGGILTSISTGADERFAFAIPTYGCGYINETPSDGSFYYNFAPNSSFDIAKYMKTWEPSLYLSKAQMPFLWVNSDHDVYFPLPIFSKSYKLTQANSFMSIHPDMGHNHPIAWSQQEPYAFADSITKNSSSLMRITSVEKDLVDSQKIKISYQTAQDVSLDSAQILYTTDTSNWTNGIVWNTQSVEKVIGENAVEVTINQNWKAYYINLVDNRGLIVSSELFVTD